VSQRSSVGCWDAMLAAMSALAPIATPPQPGTAVNEPARSMVSRMNRKLSIACVCKETGSARGARMLRTVAMGPIIRDSLYGVKWKQFQLIIRPGKEGPLGRLTVRYFMAGTDSLHAISDHFRIVAL